MTSNNTQSATNKCLYEYRRSTHPGGLRISKSQWYLFTLLPIWFCTIVAFDSAFAMSKATNVRNVFVNRTKAHLQTGGQSDEQSRLKRRFFVSLNENGDLYGRISIPASGEFVPAKEKLKVALVKGGKEVVDPVFTDNGIFTLRGVRPGRMYSLVASSRHGFLAYPIFVNKFRPNVNANTLRQIHVSEKNVYVSNSLGFQDNDLLLQNEVFKSDTDPLDTLLDEPNDQNNEQAPSGEPPSQIDQDAVTEKDPNIQIEAPAIPPTFKTLGKQIGKQVSEDFESDTEDDRDDEEPDDPILEFPAPFSYFYDAKTGKFTGRVIDPKKKSRFIGSYGGIEISISERETRANQGLAIVDTANVDSKGNFTLNISKGPGVYSLIAKGDDGIAAMSIKLSPTEELSSMIPTPNQSYVSTNQELNFGFYLPLITDSKDIRYVQQCVQDINRLEDNNIAGPSPLRSAPAGRRGGGSFGGGFGGSGQGAGQAGISVQSFGPGGNSIASSNAFGSFGRIGGLGRARLLARAGLIGGIIATSVSNGNSPRSASPSEP